MNEFIQAGFTVVGTENNENKLLSFLKENYPSVIRDTEINIEELKAVLGLPIDEKVNGYGLNFVGRNFARAKYAQKTEKELRLNTTLSKNIDISTTLNAGTQNLVLKGDNLDSLKILKNHYSGKIKCIYIDPPYNTASEEFVYPDKFNKEETEVLGLANLSESDFARMDFSFKTKKSHNGWLAFMYPRLLLARDLLSKDGVIFISIDDNEQANLKLLCDDIFGEENFVAQLLWKRRASSAMADNNMSSDHEYVICYQKGQLTGFSGVQKDFENYSNPDNDFRGNWVMGDLTVGMNASMRPNQAYNLIDPKTGISYPYNPNRVWAYIPESMNKLIVEEKIIFPSDPTKRPMLKRFKDDLKSLFNPFSSLMMDYVGLNTEATKLIQDIFGRSVFDYSKPISLIKTLLTQITLSNDIILDFFAGSGTTGHAVMQLNAEDGGNRKFILCQIDETIKKDKPAYQFCKDNHLPPVISSITIERLRRAGEKIANEIEEENVKNGMFEEHKKQVPDIGFKVFDSIEAPKLEVEDGTILFPAISDDAISRIYNMIFTVGLDEPTQVPETVVENCIYKIGNHYYITNSEKITSDDFSNAIKNGKVFIDGWTASLNGTLQNYKEAVKIVF